MTSPSDIAASRLPVRTTSPAERISPASAATATAVSGLSPRDHDHLHARARDLRDRRGHLFPEVVADADERHEGEIFQVGVPAHRPGGNRHRENAHPLLRHPLHLPRHPGFVEIPRRPARAGRQYLFGRALDEGAFFPETGNFPRPGAEDGGGKLIGAVEGEHLPPLVIFRIPERQGGVEQGAFGRVPAPRPPLFREDGGGIERRRKAQKFRRHGVAFFYLVATLPPASDQPDDARFPFGQRARLVGEQDVQSARRFDPGGLSHQHLVFEHAEHIGGENDGDHHGQPLGDGDHDDRDGERKRVQKPRHAHRPGAHIRPRPGKIHSVVDKKAVEQVGDGDENGGEIAEFPQRPRQRGELDFQGAVGRLFLNLPRNAAVKGLVPHPAHAHRPFARRDGTAGKEPVAAGEIPFPALPGQGEFFRLRALAVEGGLVDAEFARKEDAVRVDLVPRPQQHDVPHDQIGGGDLFYPLRAPHEAAGVFRRFLQFQKRRFAAVLGEGGHESGEKDRRRDADRFRPIGCAEEKNQIDGERGEQDPDDRIAETREILSEKSLAPPPGDDVGAVRPAGGEHLRPGQPPRFPIFSFHLPLLFFAVIPFIVCGGDGLYARAEGENVLPGKTIYRAVFRALPASMRFGDLRTDNPPLPLPPLCTRGAGVWFPSFAHGGGRACGSPLCVKGAEACGFPPLHMGRACGFPDFTQGNGG